MQQYSHLSAGSVSVSVYTVPADSVPELTAFRVGMQPREGGLASQLDEIRVVFPVRSLEPLQRSPIALPVVPVGVPATLVQRRPGYAAAERWVIASNANIGEARATYFPAITLSGVAGYESTATGGLLSASNVY